MTADKRNEVTQVNATSSWITEASLSVERAMLMLIRTRINSFMDW